MRTTLTGVTIPKVLPVLGVALFYNFYKNTNFWFFERHICMDLSYFI
ncbi:hypothetical protein R84B8_02383 [Treponema sp. R8-4-B8]